MPQIDLERDFYIVDIAMELGLELKQFGNYGNKKEVLANCPFCTPRDTKYHLSLNQYNNVFRCNKCGVQGGILHLISYVKGISTVEARKYLVEGISLYNPGDAAFRSANIADKQPEYYIKPLDVRSRIYNAFLDLLTLSDIHHQNLIKRGLSRQLIVEKKYRSIPQVPEIRKSICQKLSRIADLKGMPGFYTDNGGVWDFYNKSGFLVPIRDEFKRIQGFQVRLDNPMGGGKYRYFSSVDMRNGTPAESWVHIAGPVKKKICLTEGPLKGDVAHHLSGATFICIPGINAIKYLLPTLQRIGVTEVINDFDMDKKTKPEVASAVERIKSLLVSNYIRVKDDEWDPKYKGIDDFLHSFSIGI